MIEHILFWFVKLLKLKSVINNSVHFYILLVTKDWIFPFPQAVIHSFLTLKEDLFNFILY